MHLIFGLSVVFALLEWISIAAARRRAEYLAKPAALALLITWFVAELPAPPPPLGVLFAGGLAFSLVGDILLILPGAHFVEGLAAFFLTHLAYITAWNVSGVTWGVGDALAAAVLLAVTAALVHRLRRALAVKGRSRLSPAVSAYAVVLAAMLWSALSVALRPDWPEAARVLIGIGGLLFYLSDVGVAWNLFVRPAPGGRVTTMIAYHLAQFALGWGVVLKLQAG